LGLLFTLVKGNLANLVGSDLFEVDLLTIIIAYLFFFRGEIPAATFAFGQGLLIDLFSGGLQGLFTFLYLSIVGAVYLGSRFFNLQESQGQVLIVSLAVLWKKILLLIVLNCFSMEISFSKAFVLTSGASAICSGLIGPILFYLFNRLRGIFEDTPETSIEYP
jgi:rod shape-determining protein MreD